MGESTWMEKFISIMPPPFYEFFITTAPVGSYMLVGEGSVTGGYPFKLKAMPLAEEASPMLVARVNPIPVLVAQANNSAPPTFTGMDLVRWNALPVFTSPFFYRSDIIFSSEHARNLYTITSTFFRPTLGGGNTGMDPSMFVFGGAADPASIHRYGYRPAIPSTSWLADPDGQVTGGLVGLFQQTVATLIARVASHYHPTPMMAQGSVTLPLRPDILPGSVFSYTPFREQRLWDFYIESVQHTYRFGGRSTTTLRLGRGLPEAIYQGQDAQGLLQNIYLGLAERKDGQYTARTDTGSAQGLGPGLTTFNAGQSLQQTLGAIAQVYVTPQQK